MKLTSITICADDYAQHAGIDAAVLELIAQQRLHAVSCMSDAPRWLSHAAPAMREYLASATQLELGLHFNLTEGYGQRPAFSLVQLLLASHARQLNLKQLKARWQSQLDAFERGLQRQPDYLDGHQHAHQLPQVREMLLELMQQRYGLQLPWVRNTVAAHRAWNGKTRVLEMLGGRTLARKLNAAGIASNHGFAGVYGFDQLDYAGCFAAWLKNATPGMLLMCHPAKFDDQSDPIGKQRLVEYAFLRSEALPAMLQQYRIQLQPMRQSLSALTQALQPP